MKRAILCILLFAVAVSCGHRNDVLSSAEEVYGKQATVEPQDSGYKVTINGLKSEVVFKGSWSLENASAFAVTLTNLSDDDIFFLVSAMNTDTTLSRNTVPGQITTRFVVPGRQTRRVEVPVYENLPHSEIQRLFHKMKGSPYSLSTGECCFEMDKSAVRYFKVSTRRNYVGTSYRVDSLVIVPGKNVSVPEDLQLDSAAFFPFIDKYGQYKHASWQGKVISDEDLQAAREVEAADLQAHPGPQGWSKFGGWADGPRYKATGRFRTEKIDGKWWLVDPEGYLFWSHGVVRVTPSSAVTSLEAHNDEDASFNFDRRFYFEELPEDDSEFAKFYTTHDELLRPYYTARGINATYDFSSANLYRKYGKDYYSQFATLAHQRLRSWGLNTIANSSDKAICLMDKTPYVDRFEIVSNQIPGTQGYWWPVMDPFDPSFRECLVEQLTARSQEVKDPWCIGFFVDNELKWGDETFLSECIIRAPKDLVAKRVMRNYLREKYKTIMALNQAWGVDFGGWSKLLRNSEPIALTEASRADFHEFNKMVIRQYYEVIRECFDEYAPGLLYLGCRYATTVPDDDNVRISMDYVDAVSCNYYALDVARFALPGGIDKPVIIGEWHFGATDRGMFHASLIDIEDNAARGDYYEHYVRSALSNPIIIGVHWHQFSDQATSGRFCGENFNVGMTNVCDQPYYSTIDGIRRVGYPLYDLRNNF